ncbi:MAG: DUF3560 domain-containing protein, partial [Myxococcales bacterium]|nr:DUF3560 domain-containing protein [Myxococcales bacterium]
PGQPVMVGHHSEAAHRRALQRSRSEMDASVAAGKAAREAAEQAEAARRSAQEPSVGQRRRRLGRLEAELRRLERLRDAGRGSSALGAEMAELRAQITHEHRALEASGSKVYGPDDFAVGQHWFIRGYPAVVKRVNRKTVVFDPMPAVPEDTKLLDIWRVPYEELGDLRSIQRFPNDVVHASTKDAASKAQAHKEAERLRKLADKAQAAAQREIDADRNENTARRAESAANIRSRARRNLVIAQVMRRAADEVARGELRYMSQVRSRAQIEALDLALQKGRWTRERVEGRRYHGEEPSAADIDHATFGQPWVHAVGIEDLLRSAKDLAGFGESRALLTRLLKTTTDDNQMVELDERAVAAVQALVAAAKKADREVFHSTQQILQALREHEHLTRLGIVD